MTPAPLAHFAPGRSHARSLAALALALVATAAAGCSSPPTRKVETHLRPDARVSFDGKTVDRDAGGAVHLPIAVSYEYFQEAKVQVAEPGKPPLLES